MINMAENEIKKLDDSELDSASGGCNKKERKSKSLDFGTCYCGHRQDLRDIPSKSMFMHAGKKKEWCCPICHRNNVERSFKWEKIFEFNN